MRSWLDERADEMADLLMALVAVPTENPPGRELGRCAAMLADAMARLGLDPEVIAVAGPGLEDPAVVRATIGEGPELVYFHGHYDVVPAQHPGLFAPERGGGRITGRGTADMKGGLVSMLYGAVAAAEHGLLDGRRIVLHAVCDEETGSAVGSGHLRSAGLIDAGARAMLTAEPTGGAVWHAARGAITLKVRVAGREAHVGYAGDGVNAFEHATAIASPLFDLARELLGRDSMLVVGGQAGAGAGFNAVPGSAWFSVDRRFNPDEDLDAELDRLTGTIERAAADVGADVAIDVLQRQPASGTDREHPAARTLARAVTDVHGAAPAFEQCPGVLDTRWYAQLGIPAFAYGGGRLDISHGPAEFLDEIAMRRCAEVYARFAVTV